jgi:pimeloyl-ACP methyl ester carboxylesterase
MHGTRVRAHAGPLAAALPRTTLTVLEGVGHMPHHAALPQMMAALARLAATAT